MVKLIRWYNQNRELCFIIVAIIAFAVIFIQILNSMAKEELEQKKNNNNVGNSSTGGSTTISSENVSIVTGETITNKKNETNTELISKFVKCCNEGKIEEAYNMLSEECKTQIYPSLEHFRKNYCERIFYISRIYNLENWYNSDGYDIYYITYKEDVLATGQTNSNENKSDYITIIKKDGKYYLNISGYVGREKLNFKENKDNIQIVVNWVDMYMDYAILNINVKNNTESTICIDTKEEVRTTYLFDQNDVTYTAFLNENTLSQLVVNPNTLNTLNIKFNKMYNPDREITGVIFSEIVLNYEDYVAGKTSKQKTTLIVQ